MTEELKEFMEKEGFVRVSHDLDLFECPGGHIWHIDQVYDYFIECRNERLR
jgi:hypothetical protein